MSLVNYGPLTHAQIFVSRRYLAELLPFFNKLVTLCEPEEVCNRTLVGAKLIYYYWAVQLLKSDLNFVIG